MSNKTFDKGLVIREPGANVIREGYTRVVVREAGSSSQIMAVLRGTERYKRGFFCKAEDLFTYLVDPRRTLDIRTGPIPHNHRRHLPYLAYTLDVRLQINVVDPQLLVAQITHDPIRELLDQAQDAFHKPISELDESVILATDTDFCRIAKAGAWSDTQSNEAYLLAFAARFGLHISYIDMTHHPSKEGIKHRSRVGEKQRETDAELQEMEAETQLKKAKHKARMQDKQDELALEEATVLGQRRIAIAQTFKALTESLASGDMENVRNAPEIFGLVSKLDYLVSGQTDTSFPPRVVDGEVVQPELLTQRIDDDDQGNDPRELLKRIRHSGLIRRVEAMERDLPTGSHDHREILALVMHLLAEQWYGHDEEMLNQYAEHLDALQRKHDASLRTNDNDLLRALCRDHLESTP